MSDPNKRQVGGTHYRTEGTQHWDFAELDGLSYLEGCATKYLARSRKKHATPVQDLEKVVHYIEKLIALVEQGLRKPRAKQDVVSVVDFNKAYNLDASEESIVYILFSWESVSELESARQIALTLLSRAATPQVDIRQLPLRSV